MQINLTDKVALITGGAGHLGKAIAAALAECGASIAILDREKAACDTVCCELKARYGIKTFTMCCDLADDAQTHTAVHNVAKALGGVDILINNAAFVGTSKLEGWVTDLEHQTTDTWRKAIEVNLTSPFTLCRESIPFLRRSGRGSIINVGSIYGVLGPDMRLYEGTAMGNPIAYAASKGGLLQMTRWLAAVLAPEIRVNSICPGGVFRNQPEEFIKRYEARTPMKRMANEDDLCGTFLYLASDMSLYVTGQNIMVDGGWGTW